MIFFTWHTNILNCACESNRELQPRRRQQQKPHKFAYLTMKNSSVKYIAFQRLSPPCVLISCETWMAEEQESLQGM